MVHLGRADDRRGDGRFGQDPRQGNLGRRNATRLRHGPYRVDHGLVDIGDVLDLARSDDGRDAGLPRRIVGVSLGELFGPLDLGGIRMRDLELDFSAGVGQEVQ